MWQSFGKNTLVMSSAPPCHTLCMAASHAAACLLLPLASSPAISLSCVAASAPGTVYCRSMPVARMLPAAEGRELETCRDPVCRVEKRYPQGQITENRTCDIVLFPARHAPYPCHVPSYPPRNSRQTHTHTHSEQWGTETAFGMAWPAEDKPTDSPI